MDDMNSHRGVLLVDMDYSSIFRMMNQINSVSNGQYYYLCDKDGKIIYHPQQVQMNSGIFMKTIRQLHTIKKVCIRSASRGKIER